MRQRKEVRIKQTFKESLNFEIVYLFNFVRHLLQDVMRNGLYDGGMRRYEERLCLDGD